MWFLRFAINKTPQGWNTNIFFNTASWYFCNLLIFVLNEVLVVSYESIRQVCLYILYVLLVDVSELWLASYFQWIMFYNRQHTVDFIICACLDPEDIHYNMNDIFISIDETVFICLVYLNMLHLNLCYYYFSVSTLMQIERTDP